MAPDADTSPSVSASAPPTPARDTRDAEEAPDLGRWPFVLGTLAIALLAALMRLYGVDWDGRIVGLDFFGLWYDEAFSALLATKPWDEMFWVIRQDVHPPLFYVALKLWFLICPEPTVTAGYARLLPALLGAACAPAAVWLGATVFSRRVGLLTGLLMAIAPFHVLYSHELRMYSVGCLTVTLQLGFLWRVARRPNARDGALFALLAALSMLAHYYMIIPVFGQFCYFTIARVRAGDRPLLWLRRTALLGFGVFVFYLPWLFTFFVHTFNNTGQGVHAFEAGASLPLMVEYLLHWTVGTHPRLPFESYLPHPIGGFRKTLAVALVLYGLLAGGAVVAWRRRREAAWWAAGALGVPALLTALYVVGPGRFFSRCLVFLMPALFPLIAYGALSLPRRTFRVAAVVAVCAVFFASTREYLKDGIWRDTHHLIHREFISRYPSFPILCSRPFDFLPTAFYNPPRERVFLLNSPRLSHIQTVMMGRERVVYRPGQIPDAEAVFLVVSEWDFNPSREERAARRQERIAELERRWLDDGYALYDSRLFFAETRKWVYCGLYRPLPGVQRRVARER